MKPILRQLFIFVLLLAVWYIIALFFSYLLYPDYNGVIDTQNPSNNIFQGSVVLGMPRLMLSPKKKIFLIGSSNVREGFRPSDITALLPGYEVHNLATGALNITQFEGDVNLLQLVPKSVLKNSVFVLGIFYGVFVDDKKRLGSEATNLIAEALHSGLYKLDGGFLKPVVKAEHLSYLVTLLRPSYVLSHFIGNIDSFIQASNTFLRNLVRKKMIDFSVYNPNVTIYPVVDEAYKQEALKFWHEYIGTEDDSLNDEQFEKFLSLCKFINKSGANLIVLDLPLPKWHRESSIHYANYQRKKVFYIKEALKLPNVFYFDMQKNAGDFSFYDSAHPFPATAEKWCLLLKAYFTQLKLAD